MTREQIAKPAIVAAGQYIGTRGLRNNNPGNIRDDGTAWQGKTGIDDKSFVIFDSPVNGIRAMVRVLRSYAKRNLDTINEIISQWAPPSENNTAAYIAHVVDIVGKSAGEKITTADYPRLVSAIIAHENFVNPYPDDIINAGIAAGLA